jgi:hypothetical protein
MDCWPGAIDLLGNNDGLPRAYSGHDGFSEWGRPRDADTRALIAGYHNPREALTAFEDCRQLAAVNNGVGLSNQEQGLPILLCRTSASWSILWRQLTHYG